MQKQLVVNLTPDTCKKCIELFEKYLLRFCASAVHDRNYNHATFFKLKENK
jgi:hypothetical protein